MKLTILGLLFLINATNVFAQAIRICPETELFCKLETQLPSGGKKLVKESISKYNGYNSEEPSVEIASCKLESSLVDKHGVIFNVYIEEQTEMADIFLVKSSNPSTMLPGDVAFKATLGQPFYYRYYDSLLTCVLK